MNQKLVVKPLNGAGNELLSFYLHCLVIISATCGINITLQPRILILCHDAIVW